MSESDHDQPLPEQAVQARLDELNAVILDVRRKMEGLAAENQRLRELVRLSENELLNRRDQVKKLELDIQAGHNKRQEARARVENVMENMDRLIANAGGV
ncbi:MAG: hypothetical protein R8K46_10010 [Mariprofundaceae bacterium]